MPYRFSLVELRRLCLSCFPESFWRTKKWQALRLKGPRPGTSTLVPSLLNFWLLQTCTAYCREWQARAPLAIAQTLWWTISPICGLSLTFARLVAAIVPAFLMPHHLPLKELGPISLTTVCRLLIARDRANTVYAGCLSTHEGFYPLDSKLLHLRR